MGRREDGARQDALQAASQGLICQVLMSKMSESIFSKS
jgi:hypothetical protein